MLRESVVHCTISEETAVDRLSQALPSMIA
jgi:hypothetical protein